MPKMRPEDVRAKKALAAKRRVDAVNMRAAGATYPAIGKALGFSFQAAHQAVKQGLKNLAKEETMGAERLRALELRKIDSLLTGLWTDLYVKIIVEKDGKRTEVETTEIKPKIAKLILNCISQRRALLGLDPATEVELRTYHSVEDVFKDIARQAVQGTGPGDTTHPPGVMEGNGGNGRGFPFKE